MSSLSVVMHYYTGISVTWEDLGSCPVFVQSLVSGTKKVFKIHVDLKNVAQYVAEDHFTQ